jgi:energy-converting hydrogenase Eha subunit A
MLQSKQCGACQPVAGMTVSKLSVQLNFLQALLAIILGNVVYFALVPSLPLIARHRPFRVDLGMVIDFWFCLVIYGLIRAARKWR